MIGGHYAAAFTAKGAAVGPPLWWYFIASQALDILWGALSLAGVEHVQVVPGATPSNALQLDYMPFSHGLFSAALWSGLTYAAFRFLPPRTMATTAAGRPRVALAMALTVFSHFALDFVVHAPDLPILFGDGPKIGLDLWAYPLLSFLVEAALIVGGAWLYARSSEPATSAGRWAPWLVGALLIVVSFPTGLLGIVPPGVPAAVLMLLAGYVIATLLAVWLDRQRRYRLLDA